MSRTIPFITAAIVAGALSAQTALVPPMFAPAGTGSSTQNLFMQVVNRFQTVYDSTNWTLQGINHPILITGIEIAQANGLVSPTTTYPSVDVYLQNSAVDYNLVTTSFAANRSVAFPTTPNFSGSVTKAAAAGTTPNTWVFNIPLTTPFLYVPDSGNDLLVEIVVNTVPTPLPVVAQTNVWTTFSFPGHLARANRSPGSTTAATGTLSAFAPIIRFTYADNPGAAKNSSYGLGCGVLSRAFFEEFAGGSADLTNKTVSLSQNGNGGYNVNTANGAAVVAPTAPALVLGDDVVSAAQALPFTFDYPGGSTTQIFVDSNGSVLLNGTQASNIGGSGAAFMASPGHRLSPSMQDLDPSVGGSVHVEPDPANPTSVYLITWNAVPCFGAAQTSTFQVALIDNGTNDSVEYRYTTLSNTSTSNTGIAVTGFVANPGSAAPRSSDLTAGPISTQFPERANLALSVAPRPIIGTAVNFTTSNLPASGVSLLFFSGGQINPGFDLGIIGMTGGCSAYIVLPEFMSFLNFGTPSVVNNVPIPNDPLLVGALAYAQVGALDPTYNAFGFIASQGLKLEIGNN